MEEESESEKLILNNKIGWIYVAIGLAYIVSLTILFSLVYPINESSHPSDAFIMFIIFSSISIPIILSGIIIQMQKIKLLIIPSIILIFYVLFFTEILRQINQGSPNIELLIFFSLVPGVLMVYNFSLINRFYKTNP